MSNPVAVRRAKAALRRRLLARRAQRTTDERTTANQLIAAHIAVHSDDVRGATVAAYLPIGDEPGRLEHLQLLVTAGARLMLPIARSRTEPLAWGWFGDVVDLAAGPHGLWQPANAEPGLTALGADLVVVPAVGLAADGARLGRGRGYYDRALADVPSKHLIGLVYDDEVLESLPTEPHDVRVGWICTPSDLRRAASGNEPPIE